MRIEQETRNIYVGGQQATERMTPANMAKNLQKGRIFAGNLQLPADKIAERRKEAQAKAMKIIGETFAGELEVDDSIAEMEENVAKLQEEMVAAKEELNKVQERKKELESRTDLTDEEYRNEMEDIKRAESHFTGLIMDAKKIEDGTVSAITDIKIERLKHHPMVDASADAEKVMEAANKEIIGMLKDEAMDHIDGEMEKRQEAAEKAAEKKKEEKERIEAMKAEKEEKEEDTALDPDYIDAATKQMVKIAQTGESVQKELQNIVKQLKLDLEDLKGAAVDEGV
ncbi:MAG: hypothetical protein J1E35_07215 [Lachnospiraceae bacterium]|nr:hypothetical protein [Lachnospiraceae bacterium]